MMETKRTELIESFAKAGEGMCEVIEKWAEALEPLVSLLTCVMKQIAEFAISVMALRKRLFLCQVFLRLQWLWDRLDDGAILAIPIGEETMELWLNEEMPTVV